MGNRYTYETNTGHGAKAARVCVALTDVEIGRLRAYARRWATSASAVIRAAIAEYMEANPDGGACGRSSSPRAESK